MKDTTGHALAVLALPFLFGGCAANVRDRPLATPEWSADGQAKCKVRASKAEPLVVEWPSADRAKLEALTKRGVVAVKYNGCEMQVMGACSAKGEYRYVGTTLKRDVVRIKDADELYAKLPFGAAGLEETLRQSGQLDVTMSLVGRYAADRPVIHEADLGGSCAGATHVISALIVGAFEFSARATRTGKERASVFEGAAGASTELDKQVLTKDGEEATCRAAADNDPAPPAGCRALIRVEVLPLPEAESRAAAEEAARKRELEDRRSAASTRRTIGWSVGGAGVGAGLLAGVLAVQSRQRMNEIEDGGLASSAAIEETESGARGLATGAWIAGGVGLAAAGVGAFLVLTGKEPAESSLHADAKGLRVVW
jgi:hypothetical protein